MPDAAESQPNDKASRGAHGRKPRPLGEITSAATGGRSNSRNKATPPDQSKASDTENSPVDQGLQRGRRLMSTLLRSWISLNGWTYDDVTSIVEALSGGVPLIHGSQISNLIGGKLEPKPRLFVGLDFLNKACAYDPEARKQLPKEIAVKLIGSRVVRSAPSTSQAAWTAGDFLNLFCGLKPYPVGWLDLHDLRDQTIYTYLQNLTRLVHELVKAKNDEILPSFMTITQNFPSRTRPQAQSAIAGTSVLSASQFEEFMPTYATGIGEWLGAIVSPYALLEYVRKPWVGQASPEAIYNHFVNDETTLGRSLKPQTIELDIGLSDEENASLSAADMEFWKSSEGEAYGADSDP